jgi:hypothetical protein
MYKILKNFKDKYTGERYVAGSEKDFSDKRAKEILKKGNLIEKIENKEPIVDKDEKIEK